MGIHAGAPPHARFHLGDRRFNDRWDDASLAAVDAGYAHDRQALDTLKATVDRAALTPADQLNYDLYARNLQTDLDGQRFHFYLCPLNQRGGVQNADEILEDLRVSTPQDYQELARSAERLPALIQQNTDLMKEGIKEHILLPKVVMDASRRRSPSRWSTSRRTARSSSPSSRSRAFSHPSRRPTSSDKPTP